MHRFEIKKQFLIKPAVVFNSLILFFLNECEYEIRGMKNIVSIVTFVFLCIMLSSCSTPRKTFDVEIPEGIVIATDAQSKLVEGVKGLSQGMTRNEVKQKLGNPAEENPDCFFYLVLEGVEGGYYVTAMLLFDKQGLSDANIDFGHMTRFRIDK